MFGHSHYGCVASQLLGETVKVADTDDYVSYLVYKSYFSLSLADRIENSDIEHSLFYLQQKSAGKNLVVQFI